MCTHHCGQNDQLLAPSSPHGPGLEEGTSSPDETLNWNGRNTGSYQGRQRFRHKGIEELGSGATCDLAVLWGVWSCPSGACGGIPQMKEHLLVFSEEKEKLSSAWPQYSLSIAYRYNLGYVRSLEAAPLPCGLRHQRWGSPTNCGEGVQLAMELREREFLPRLKKDLAHASILQDLTDDLA